MMNWIFICPADNRPVGGNKVIYRSVEYLCSLGYQSEVFHPKRANYRGRAFRALSFLFGPRNPFQVPNHGARLEWFNHNANICNRSLSPDIDVLIIPEVMVPMLVSRAKKLSFRYVIFYQNGFLVDSGSDHFSKKDLSQLYEDAEAILSISDDTTCLLQLSYPGIKSRVFRVFADKTRRPEKFLKENLITYMPRKLALHAGKVLFFLKSRLPTGWVIQPIDGLSESEAHSLLARSKIFLSFSELEGFGLPPYEAALLGNLVVGYSGSGGDEFFRRPVFRKVENGDLVSYVDEIITAISDWDNSESVESLVLSPSSWLIDEYSDAKVNKLWHEAVAFVNKSISNGGTSL